MKAILKEHQYCKKVVEKHFNKNLIMSEEEEFQSSSTCWICENSLIVTMTMLEIIGRQLENLEVQLIVVLNLQLTEKNFL